MTPLGRALARRIRGAGPLTLAEFMAEALGNPVHGYYATRDPLGAAGDFTTAPEISQMFGELIGLWCADLWQRLGRPDPVILAELGPGRGTLMADALRAARAVPGFAAALRLHLVETSPALRAAQAGALAPWRPEWHDGLATLPAGPLLLVANEFLDALPIRQFVKTPSGWRERLVGLAGDGESLAFGLAPTALAGSLPVPAPLAAAPAGSVFEICPAALALAEDLARRLAATGGAALLVDYGHAAAPGVATLQAVRRHRRAAVLDAPGETDLTAHVDFAALAAAAEAAGARSWGPVDQGAFLAALGLAARAEQLLRAAPPAAAERLRSGWRRLADPAEMGSLFKVLAITHRTAPVPSGFAAPEAPEATVRDTTRELTA